MNRSACSASPFVYRDDRQQGARTMMKHSVGAAILFAVVWAGMAHAAPKADEVDVTACAYPGITGLCMMINGPDGTVYNITSANPPPPFDTAVRLRGTLTDKLSICGQGRVLDDISWSGTKRRCPR
jgi:hypothetical protein